MREGLRGHGATPAARRCLLVAVLLLVLGAAGCTTPARDAASGTDRGAASTHGAGTATGTAAADGRAAPGDVATQGARPAEPGGADAPGTAIGHLHAPASLAAISGVGGLPDGLAEAIARDPHTLATSVVRGDTLRLTGTRDAAGRVVDELPAEWWFPVEVLAFDPAAHAEVVGPTALEDLDPEEAVLSTSAARVRGLDAGGVLAFADGTELTVSAVVDDVLIGAAEIAVPSDSVLAVSTPRAVLVRAADPDVAAGWASLDRLASVDPEGRWSDTPLAGVRGDEVPVLRHAAGVLPPARLKDHYGEFAISQGPGRWIRQGASWLREYHTIAEVPILGEVECHADAIGPLTAAMSELLDRGMASLVDGEDFGGCWAPRTSGGDALSSHAWGIAVDLNVQGNHYGAEPTIAPEVVAVMARHGFVWGGTWPVPDGMHFELVPDREVDADRHG